MSYSVYSAIGARLTQYSLNPLTGELLEQSALDLPAGMQYGWKHVSKQILYIACSDGGPGKSGTQHYVCAWTINPDGSLTALGQPTSLRSRPVHLTTDRLSQHILLAYNSPSAISVHRIKRDGSVGEEVVQPSFELGACAHQIMVSLDNQRVIVPVRGNDPEDGHPELPGAIEIFDYADGILAHRQRIIPNAGYEFGPRHVDFHPTKPWMYLSIERQNQIAFFELGKTVVGPLWRKTTLARPEALKPRQLVGAIHVHPEGRHIYVSNRADGTINHQDRKVFNGAENTISVFSIDAVTGEPTLIQTEPTRGMHVRTFSIDPTGTILIAACMVTRDDLLDGVIRNIPGGLSVFKIEAGGTLTFLNKLDLDVTQANLFWMGIIARRQ